MAVRNQRKIKNVSASMAEQLEELIAPAPQRRTRARAIDKHIDDAVKPTKESGLDSNEQTNEVSMKDEVNEIDQEFKDALTAMCDRVQIAYPDYIPNEEHLAERSKSLIAEVIAAMLTSPEEERTEDAMYAKVVELLEEELMTEAQEQVEQTTAPGAVVVSASAASVEQPADEAPQGEVSQEDAVEPAAHIPYVNSALRPTFQIIKEMYNAPLPRGNVEVDAAMRSFLK